MLRELLRRARPRKVLPDALPVLCHALLLYGPAPAWRAAGLALVAATLALLLFDPKSGQPGRHAVGRALLALTPFTAALAAGIEVSAAWGLAALGAAGLVAIERPLGRFVSASGVAAANLRSNMSVGDSTTRRTLLIRLSTVAVLAVQVPIAVPGAASAVPYAVVLAALPAAALATARACGLSRLVLPSSEDIAWTAANALDRLDPAFMVYFAGPPGGAYQLATWLPYLEAVDGGFFIMTREPHHLAELAGATGRPVVYVEDQRRIDAIIPESVSTVFYVNNDMKNTNMVRNADLLHIQLLHGDSDKPSGADPAAAMYDRIFVAGQAGVDRYADRGVGLRSDRFDVVGRPQVSGLDIPRTEISDVKVPTVLYAPTWTGIYVDADHCSLPLGPQLVRTLLDRGATVLFRPHPRTDRDDRARRARIEVERLLRADAATTGRAHVWGAKAREEMTLYDCFDAADALVCDVSSVATDWLYTEKPFAVVDARNEGPDFPETFGLARVSYRIDSTGANLDPVLDELLKTDPLRFERARAKVYHLGDFPAENYERAFVDVAQKYIDVGVLD
ncbi:CDP-glycerol glycerophosphotransferase family protein [Glycomyces sp. L485]|uniref:CDP-glycerol glycerophosphotransferase family protein n=1 Tax=Glycomyces sp. L485 TaxID=2909235 RepID=UPI001F4AC8D9|nr:CDP-glycerol glycerophosphotransferase family protein [Glycomyces sp. L485]MCH7232109.1 CDP-glycerol glycerophosphotransferase family protein [Glycomyces sp. L485]